MRVGGGQYAKGMTKATIAENKNRYLLCSDEYLNHKQSFALLYSPYAMPCKSQITNQAAHIHFSPLYRSFQRMCLRVTTTH